MATYHATVHTKSNKKHETAITAKSLPEAKKKTAAWRKREGFSGAVTSVFRVNS
jgi:hypothetical protein